MSRFNNRPIERARPAGNKGDAVPVVAPKGLDQAAVVLCCTFIQYFAAAMPMWECIWAFADEDGARVQAADLTAEPRFGGRRRALHRAAAIVASGGRA
ncbi:hypothetical protein DIE18_35525 [Burkholderia sp. Bp9125]|nr:hypothetical protein DIE18_35525 [Burkholderia sp. Bp9125]